MRWTVHPFVARALLSIDLGRGRKDASGGSTHEVAPVLLLV